MSRYRLYPTGEQEKILLGYCDHARFVWNLAWELHQFGERETYGQASRRKRKDGTEYTHQKRRAIRPVPGYVAQARMLTEARAEFDWLAAGAQVVQQQALRDFDQAMRNFYKGTHAPPGVRRKGKSDGFRITGRRGPKWDARRLNRNWGEVKVPKVGWVRFRWSRDVPGGVKSYRVTRDRSGRWHVAFAVIPDLVPGPGTGEVVGIDRGVKVSAALSTGEMLNVPGLNDRERRRLARLERKLAKAKRGSGRRGNAKVAVAKVKARETGRRKDWAEKTSTDLARRFDVIRVEDLKVGKMTRSAKGTIEKPGKNVAAKAGLNREIRAAGWGMLVTRLEQKAPGRVEKVPPAYTSQCCSACGHVDRNSRESQAKFLCTACGYADNADVNAAKVIAAGHAVKARRGDAVRRPVNREPQLTLLTA